MNTFSILYAGQLRFVECINESLPLFKDAKTAHASFHTVIQDGINLNVGSNHSVDTMTITEAVDYVKNISAFNSVDIVEDIEKVNWPLQHIHTAIKGFENIDSDFLILVTSDIVIKNIDVTTLINSLKLSDTPTVYGKKTANNELYNLILILNKAAVDKLYLQGPSEVTKYQSRESQDDLYWKTEYAWFSIFKNLEIKIKKLSGVTSIRYRPNMGSIDNLKNLDYSILEQHFNSYSAAKAAVRYAIKEVRSKL